MGRVGDGKPRRDRAAGEAVRVLFVNAKQRPPLGADTWVHAEIMRRIDRERVEVHAACVLESGGEPTPTLRLLREIPDIAIRPINLGRELSGETRLSKVFGVLSLVPALASLVRLALYVRRQRIEVIHTADRPRDAAASVVIGKLTRTPVLVHVHVGYDARWMRGMLRWAIREADGLISISEFVTETLISNGHDADRIHLVLNGIDESRWVPPAGGSGVRAELGIGPDVPVVVTACRLFRAKGVAELVRAVGEVRDLVPDVTLLVAGREMEHGFVDELHHLIGQLGLHGQVLLLGRRDDIVDVMAAADVFAMPSYQEPFGLVYAEAMALGLPVVALDNGGTPEVVRHGLDGLLSPAGDAGALAEHLRRLLVDPDLRHRLGERGRQHVREQLTSDRMAADAADVFERVASGRHLAPAEA
ncbi:MAG: glycosyltransferase family 4 protein [Ilumatobacter sp.]|nr:glycosyltransferase family 4 protein [Ilumatobacter sp.]